MKIGIRRSPFLDPLLPGMEASGVRWTSTNDTGADFYLCWGWPQAEQVARDNHGQHSKIICLDAHPFALRKGDESGARIFQLGNWGALAKYPPWRTPVPKIVNKAKRGGPVLVLGQVYTAMQAAQGLVDVWHTHGYEAWLAEELAKPGRVYRKHPRVWEREHPGERQPSLADDLAGCSAVASWNSTAAIHALQAGYPATAAEAHGWAHLPLDLLAGQVVSQVDYRSGAAWDRYAEWLQSSRSPRI